MKQFPFVFAGLGLALLGAGCGASPSPIAAPPAPVGAPQAKTPPPPLTPRSDLSLSGTVNFTGKLVTRCSPAKYPSYGTNEEPRGWQFSGGTPLPQQPTDPRVIVNFFRGLVKEAGAQPIESANGGLLTVQYHAREGELSQTFGPVDGQSRLVISPDFNTATISGTFADLYDQAKTVQVNATLVCQ